MAPVASFRYAPNRVVDAVLVGRSPVSVVPARIAGQDRLLGLVGAPDVHAALLAGLSESGHEGNGVEVAAGNRGEDGCRGGGEEGVLRGGVLVARVGVDEQHLHRVLCGEHVARRQGDRTGRLEQIAEGDRVDRQHAMRLDPELLPPHLPG